MLNVLNSDGGNDARAFDLLVFDWDGTIADSSLTIVKALQQACRETGLPAPSASAVLNIIGLGMREGLFQAVPTLKEEQFDPLCRRYRRLYFSLSDEAGLYAGVVEGLRRLREAGYFLAVATGKSRVGLDLALEKTALTSSFDRTRCADESLSKPAPDMLLELMDFFGVEADRTLMIGDTTHDLQMAENAGVAAVAMTYGAHETDVLLSRKPLACFDRFGGLVDWLCPDDGNRRQAVAVAGRIC